MALHAEDETAVKMGADVISALMGTKGVLLGGLTLLLWFRVALIQAQDCSSILFMEHRHCVI